MNQSLANDSLALIINNLKFNEKKIDSLNDLAWTYIDSNLNQFRGYGTIALHGSKSLSYLRGKCNSLQILGVYHAETASLDSALIYYDQALQRRIELGDSSLISGTLNNIGIVYERKGLYLQSLENYGQAYQFVPASNLEKRARLSDNIGIIYTQLGNYTEALKYNEEALLFFKNNSPGSVTYAKCLLHRANIYDLMSAYEEALRLYRESIVIFNRDNVKLDIARTKNNIGNIYKKLGQIDTSINYYNDALFGYKELDYFQGIAGTELNLGLNYKLLGEYNQAINYLNNSLEYWIQSNNNQKQAEALISLGNLYITMGVYRKAKRSFERAETLSPTNITIRSEIYQGLSLSYGNLNQHKKAFPYYLKYIELRDSIELQRIQWRNLEAKYTENENKIELLKKERNLANEKSKKEKIINLALLIGLLLLSALFFSLFLSWKSKKKRLVAELKAKEKQQEVESLLKDQELVSIRNVLEVQDKERKRIAQDLHDRLGSMLSMVKLHFQKTNKNIEKLKRLNQEEYHKANKLLDEACDEVRKIAHDLLSGTLKNFGLVAAIEELQSTLINTSQYEVELITHQLEERLPEKYEITIYRIIQELVSNILRHANASEISFQLLQKDNILHVSVEDNGIGFDSEDSDIRNGMGLKNIHSRLHPLGGKMVIDSHKERGTSIFIEIPLNQD